jgi:hypothetical protein
LILFFWDFYEEVEKLDILFTAYSILCLDTKRILGVDTFSSGRVQIFCEDDDSIFKDLTPNLIPDFNEQIELSMQCSLMFLFIA